MNQPHSGLLFVLVYVSNCGHVYAMSKSKAGPGDIPEWLLVNNEQVANFGHRPDYQIIMHRLPRQHARQVC